MEYETQRQFVRHPIRLPLAVRPKNGQGEFLALVGDISEGGLSFSSAVSLEAAGAVEVELIVHDTRFRIVGTVASCAEQSDHTFRVGLKFVEVGQSFRLKLAEQVLRIDELRDSLSKERGTPVTKQEAARIWVEQYASAFADLYPVRGAHGQDPR